TTAVVTDADRAQVTVHDVVAVAGAVHPLVHRVGRGRVAGGDVLPPGAHGPAHLLDAQGRRLAAAGGRTARRPRLAGVTGGALTVVRAGVRGLLPRAVGEVVTLRHVHAAEPRGAAQVPGPAQAPPRALQSSGQSATSAQAAPSGTASLPVPSAPPLASDPPSPFMSLPPIPVAPPLSVRPPLPCVAPPEVAPPELTPPPSTPPLLGPAPPDAPSEPSSTSTEHPREHPSTTSEPIPSARTSRLP